MTSSKGKRPAIERRGIKKLTPRSPTEPQRGKYGGYEIPALHRYFPGTAMVGIKLGRPLGNRTPVRCSRGNRPTTERTACLQNGCAGGSRTRISEINSFALGQLSYRTIKFARKTKLPNLSARESLVHRVRFCSFDDLGPSLFRHVRTLRILCRWCKCRVGSQMLHDFSTVQRIGSAVNSYFRLTFVQRNAKHITCGARKTWTKLLN